MKIFRTITNTLLAAGSYTAAHIPNCLMVRILSLLTGIRIPETLRNANLRLNKEVLLASAEASGFFIPGQSIENQNEWESVRFGISTMKYSGCEIMAVYNALWALGRKMTARDMAELICEFEKKGAVLKGRWGCSPMSICQYFSCRGYRVSMTTSAGPDKIRLIAENSDTLIITACNDRNDIRRMIHTISVTKEKNGTFVLHNANKKTGGKYSSYAGESPLKSLQDAIGAISQGNAASICIIGVSRK